MPEDWAAMLGSADFKAAIREIRETHEKPTNEHVVAAAQDPESPLHPWFEWDDTKAAEEWRLQQVRIMYRCAWSQQVEKAHQR